MGPRFRGDDDLLCGTDNDQHMSPHLRAGTIAAIATLLIDQASKLWLLYVFDLAERGVVRVTPFFDLVLAWNTGISYGLLQTESTAGQIALTAVKVVAVVALAIWMPLYLLIMQKRVYGQGWTMTVLKYCILGFCYFVLLSLGAAFTLLASLVWM